MESAFVGGGLDPGTGGVSRSQIMFPDPHLDSPILPESRDAILIICGHSDLVQTKNSKVLRVGRHPRFSRVASKVSDILAIISTEAQGSTLLTGVKPQHMYGRIFQMKTGSTSKSLRRYQDAVKCAYTVEGLQLDDLQGVLSEWFRHTPSLQQGVMEKLKRLKESSPTKHETEILTRWTIWHAMVEHMRLTKKNRRRSDPVEPVTKDRTNRLIRDRGVLSCS